MGNLAPRRQFAQNQPVIIIGCEISKEHVPEELKKFGPGAYAMHSGLMYKSRPNAPDLGVTRVKFPSGKDELFLTNDLYPPGTDLRSDANFVRTDLRSDANFVRTDLRATANPSEGGRTQARPNTGSRIVNARS